MPLDHQLYEITKPAWFDRVELNGDLAETLGAAVARLGGPGRQAASPRHSSREFGRALRRIYRVVVMANGPAVDLRRHRRGRRRPDPPGERTPGAPDFHRPRPFPLDLPRRQGL